MLYRIVSIIHTKFIDYLSKLSVNFRRNSRIIAIIFLLLISIHPIISVYDYPYNYLGDDAFITLTYSKNIANGNGFTFNHPPSTLGTTTPLFALIVALLSKLLSIDIRFSAVLISALCWIGIIWTLFVFRRIWNLKNWQVCIISLVIIGLGWRAWLQMEAYLFAFLLTISISFLYSGSYLLSGFTTALLFLTRGEGVLLLPLFLAVILLQEWSENKLNKFTEIFIKKSLKLLGGFLIPASIWFVYANYTFGSFLPNTLIAKQAQGVNGLLHTFLHHLTTNWIKIWIERYNLIWIAFTIGLLDSFVFNRKRLIWIAWISAYIIGYSLLNVAGYDWYRLPIVFILKLFTGFGLVKIIEKLVNDFIKKSFLFVPLLLFTIYLFSLLSQPILYRQAWIGDRQRGESYIKLSQWFNNNTEDDESIAFIEIGYLGYYTNNKIIDLLGLISPDIALYVSKNDLSSGFWKYKPDYLVYMIEFDWALSSIKNSFRFENEYKVAATLPGPWGNDIIIYKRKSL